jgi:hypothetical protein
VKILERATGIEPVTSSLGSWHSTAELRPLNGTVEDMFYMELTGTCQRAPYDMSEMAGWIMGVAVAGLGYVTHYSIAPVFGSLQPCINL